MGARQREEDYVGKKFNNLTVLKLIGIINKNMWCEAICDCGKVGKYSLNTIKRNNTKSCGCLKIEKLKTRERNHGLRRHPLYYVWNNMRQRCLNKKNRDYKNYGGRGVIICKEWSSFINFYNWSIENGWSEDLEIDKDFLSPYKTGLIYCPKYCCFVSSLVNMNNRSVSVKYKYKNTEKSVSEWSREYRMPRTTLMFRLNKGWGIEEALETPIKGQHNYNQKIAI